MELAYDQRRVLIEQTQRDAELESLLNSLTLEIDRQRSMIRALAYASIGTAVVFFLFGVAVSSVVA